MFSIALLLHGCANAESGPYVYTNGSIAIKVKMNKSNTDSLVKDQKKFDASKFGLKEVMTASHSDDEEKVENSLLEVGQVEYKWFEYPIGESSTGHGFVESPIEVKKTELNTAWDRIYIEIRNQSSKLNMLNKQEGADEFEVVAIEPNFILVNSTYEEMHEKLENKKKQNVESVDLEKSAAKQQQDSFKVISKPSDIWGYGEPGWHLTDEYSQLNAAKEELKTYLLQNPNAERVLIAHLDTGFYAKDALMFDKSASENLGQHMNDQSSNFAPEKKCKDKRELIEEELSQGQCPGHGTETLSVLAGGSYFFTLDGQIFSGELGANPYANTLDYRISDSVVHLFPSNMAKAISSAIKTNKADIISLSAGGLPSPLQRDAVNLAYEKGTAIFAICCHW